MFNKLFQDKRVLVTGHTGFKGSWLSIWLHRMGAKVAGYSLAPETTPCLFDAASVSQAVAHHIVSDVRDPQALREALDSTRPELIIHMAAQPLVRRSYAEPVMTLETNFNGTLNLLEAVRLRDEPCAVVVVTTDKCYRNNEQVWGYREDDPLGGDDPYSASKAAAELLVHTYRRSFFAAGNKVRLASVRGGNVIGGGDWSQDRILPDLVRSIQSGQPLEVRSPGAIRPWQHVLELLAGYLLVASRLLSCDDNKWCSSWNFGPLPGEDMPVGELVAHFCHTWGEGDWTDASRPGQLHEANILRLAIDKSVSELGWRPRWSVSDAVQRTALWYREFYAGRAALDLVAEDIQAFELASRP